MNPKRLIQVFKNHELGLQERLFRLLVTIGLMGLAMGILVGLVLGESMANTLSLLVVFALAVAITYFSIHFHKIQIGAVLISVLLIYFALPFNFLTSGGIYGGGPIWLMFGVVFVCLVVEKKAKYILIASSFCLYGACYLTAYDGLLESQNYGITHDSGSLCRFLFYTGSSDGSCVQHDFISECDVPERE